jgi:Uncharacterised protein family UPF0547
LAEKTRPDCAEKVKAEARVCRFCGYRFDLAEAEQRRAEKEDSPGRQPTQRVRTSTPPSCGGCSCGSCVVVLVAVVAVAITLGGLGVTGSAFVAIAAAVLASRLLNTTVQRPLVARMLRLPSPALEERIRG